LFGIFLRELMDTSVQTLCMWMIAKNTCTSSYPLRLVLGS